MKEYLLDNNSIITDPEPYIQKGLDNENHIPITDRLVFLEDLIRPKKYRTGVVVHVENDKKDPTWAVVYFDGGRRVKTQYSSQCVIIEGVRMKINELVQHKIDIGDLVESNYTFRDLKKLASKEKFEEVSISNPMSSFRWSDVKYVTIWN